MSQLVGDAQAWPALGYGTLPIRRILVVQTQRLGDALCATPLFAALREQFPQAHIAALVQPGIDRLLADGPDLNELLTYDREAARRSLLYPLRLMGELRDRQFDWALTIHAASRVAFALWKSGIPWRTCVWRYASGRKPHWAWTYHQHVRQDRLAAKQHEIEYNLEVLRELGMAPRSRGYCVYLGPHEREAARDWLRVRGRVPELPLAVLHPGHGGGRQVWAPERYAQVAEGLLARGYQVAVTGSAGEVELVRAVAAGVRKPVLELAGGMNLRQFASVLGDARMFVSIATGPMHLAAAMGVPVVTLFGPTELEGDLKRFYPYGTASRLVPSAVRCPCPGMKQCANAVCMTGIAPEAVLAAADALRLETGS